jgi:hypothetical protein
MGKHYFYVILDNRSNFGFTALLCDRPEAVSFYKQTEAFVKHKTGRCVLTVQVDGARKLSDGALADHFRTAGIMVQVTAPYAHSQNGKAEHYVRTLEDGSQVLLPDSRLPASFWGDAVLTIQYIRNRVLTSTKMPEHPYHKARDVTYTLPQHRNIGALAKPVPAGTKKPEAVYRTLPAIHDPNIATTVYKRTLEMPITISYHELLSLSPKVCSQVRDTVSSKRIAPKETVVVNPAAVHLYEDSHITDEERSYLFADEEISDFYEDKDPDCHMVLTCD